MEMAGPHGRNRNNKTPLYSSDFDTSKKERQVTGKTETRNKEGTKGSREDQGLRYPGLLRTELAGEYLLMSYAPLRLKRTTDAKVDNRVFVKSL